MSADPPRSRSRTRNALHLLWVLPLAGVLSMFPIALASFSLCGIGCYSPGFIRYEELPLAVLMCAIGGLIVFHAVQLVPWTQRAWTRLLVSIPAGLLWGGIWLLLSLRAFDPMSPIFGR